MNHINDIVKGKDIGRLNNNNIGNDDPYFEDKISDWLSTKLGSNSDISDRYFRKIARNIPRPTIDRILSYSLDVGDNPAKLFSFLMRKELAKRGVTVGKKGYERE